MAYPGVEEVPTTVPRPALNSLAVVADEVEGMEDQPKADPTYPLAPLPRRWRFDLWEWEDETEAEIAASWAAIGQAEVEDGRALRELKALVSVQHWTPRTNFSGDRQAGGGDGGAMGNGLSARPGRKDQGNGGKRLSVSSY